jgi:hypothetical protein
VRILSWLLGKRETSAPSSSEQTAPVGEEQLSAAPPSDERPTPAINPAPKEVVDPPADNLRRWRESGQPRAWVEARQGRWDHDAWLALLDDLQRSSFWPMNPDAVGLMLEETRQEWLSRN